MIDKDEKDAVVEGFKKLYTSEDLKCITCGMRGHVDRACWFAAQMKDKSLEEKTRNAWRIVSKVEEGFNKKAKRDLKAKKKHDIKVETEKKL